MPNDFEKKFEDLIDSVGKMNQRFDELKGKAETESAEFKSETEKVREEVTKKAEEFVAARTAHEAELKGLKEDVDALQREILEGARNGEQKNDALHKRYDEAFGKYLKKGVVIPQEDVERVCMDIVQKSMFGADEQRVMTEAKALVAGSDADGGFFLTTDRSGRISQRMFETSAIRPLADVQSTTSDVFEMVLDDDEPDSGWVGEVQARPDTGNAKVGVLKIPVHELYAQPKASQKMLDDSGFDIVSWHQGKVSSKFARDENAAFTTGDGSQKPRGFLAYPAWSVAGTYERNAVEQITTAGSGVIAANDLLDMQSALIEDYHAAAQWAMNRRAFFEDVLALKGTDGHFLFNPVLLREGGDLMLLGKRVNFFNDMPVVAANALSVCLADWSEFYTIVDRFGIRVVRDPYTEKPFTKFYTTKRVGGAVTNFEAGKILKIKA